MKRHVVTEPSILYLGTPVVLVSSLDEAGATNLAPMSSAFWLGWRAVLGLGSASKTAQNLIRTREAVLNMPSSAMADAVDRLALTTGSDPVPAHKVRRGYRHEAAKFTSAGLRPVESVVVGPPRVAECPIALEAVVTDHRPMAADDEDLRGGAVVFELRVVRVHADPDVLADGEADRIDPDRWRPLIMSFQRFYGLGPEAGVSRLATIPERSYRSPDVDRARLAAVRR